MQTFGRSFIVLVSAMFLGCQSMVHDTAKEMKYSAYEMVGVQKRDLFKKEVKKVKEGQQDTGEAFKDALDRLQKVYQVDGGKLEKQYKSLNSSYESAQKEVQSVHGRIQTLEEVATDLFSEWRKEIAQITSAEMRKKSAQSLQKTLDRYADFHSALKKSEARMDPVLVKLKDHVLFLKHNLNAQAIAGLKVESGKIQNDIEVLIKDMNASIGEAEELIKTM